MEVCRVASAQEEYLNLEVCRVASAQEEYLNHESIRKIFQVTSDSLKRRSRNQGTGFKTQAISF